MGKSNLLAVVIICTSIICLTKATEVVVVQHPQNATVPTRTRVVLSCKFNQDVNCDWMHNDRLVYINKYFFEANTLRYQSGDGEDTTDCSLLFPWFTSLESGKWTCKNRISPLSDNKTVTFTAAWLFSTTKSNLSMVQHPQNTSAHLYTTVVLHCKFSDTVDCAWVKDSITQEIGKDYSYKTFRYQYSLHYPYSYQTINPRYENGDGVGTTDCSIRITVLSMQTGKWICKADTDDGDTIYSNAAWLSLPGTTSIQVVQHPENASVPLSTRVVLSCKFNQEVDCQWEHNGVKQYINKYYFEATTHRYLTGNGEDTTDCSLLIPSFSSSDIGKWICKKFTYRFGTTTSSNAAWLYPTSYYIKLDKEPPSSSELKLGQEVILECKFNDTTNCHWTKDGHAFYMSQYSEGYSYNNSNGSNTRDCSLKIKSFNVTDVANWTCSSDQHIHYANVTSRLASIRAEGPIAYIGIEQNPKSQVVNRGDYITLDCRFNTSVHCSWVQSNGTTVRSGDYSAHYWFLDRHEPKADCSLKINSVQRIDEGLWTCTGRFNNVSQKSTSAAYLTVQDVKLDGNKTTTKLNITSATMSASSSILTFTCKFNMPANCYWLYRQHFHSTDYKLLKVTTNSKQCTILIHQSVANIKRGLYHCQGISDETDEFVFSEELTVDNQSATESMADLQLLEEPKNATVKYGQSVTLVCTFRQPVNCIWFLGDELRYSDSGIRIKRYRVPHVGGAHTDWSLTIQSVQAGDIGYWKCQGVRPLQRRYMDELYSMYQQYVSGGAWISVQKMPQDPELVSRNGVVANGTLSSADLTSNFHCISRHGNPPADLQWRLNGDPVAGSPETAAVSNFLYTTRLFWDPEVKVQDGDQLSCVADHVEYDNVKYTMVRIAIPIPQRHTATLASPTIMFKSDTVSLGRHGNRSVSRNNSSDLLCRVESMDTKQTLFWEYAERRYGGIPEDRPTEDGRAELWLHWDNAIPLQDDNATVACITELTVTPRRTSVQILKSARQDALSGKVFGPDNDPETKGPQVE